LTVQKPQELPKLVAIKFQTHLIEPKRLLCNTIGCGLREQLYQF